MIKQLSDGMDVRHVHVTNSILLTSVVVDLKMRMSATLPVSLERYTLSALLIWFVMKQSQSL